MGLRSWLTPVNSYADFEEVAESIENNPGAYGIHYVLKLEVDNLPFAAKTVVVAWSSDSSVAIDDLHPEECRERTWLLDNWLDHFPDYHDEPGGPGKYGTILPDAKAVQDFWEDRSDV